MEALSRRAAFTAGAAALATAALPLPAIAAAGCPDAALLAMEQRVIDIYRRWEAAIDVLGEADLAVYALRDVAPGSAAMKSAEDHAKAAHEAEGLLCTEVGVVADTLIAIPAATIAGLACKARVTMLLKSDDHPELILEDLVRFGGRANA